MTIRYSPARPPYAPDTARGDDWRDQAACLGTDPELFAIPGSGTEWERDDHADQLEAALTHCRACPVAAECLASALLHGDQDTVRGGTTPNQRARIRRNRARPSRKDPA